MASSTTPTSAAPAPSSSDAGSSAIAPPTSHETTTMATVTTMAMATWTIGLASSGRQRSGMAANVGRIVPWLNSLVMPMLAMTPSSMAATIVVPEMTSARSAATMSSANSAVSTVTTTGNRTASERQHPRDGDRGHLDPLAADGGDHDALPGGGNPSGGPTGGGVGGAAPSPPDRYSWASAVACRKASSSDALCGDSSCSTAPTLRRQLADPLDRQAVDVDAVGTGRLVRGTLPAQVLGERRRPRRADPHPPRGVAVDELADRALLDQPAPADDDEVVGHQRDLRQQVAADEHGASLAGQVDEDVADPADALGVEPVGRLVEDHRVRIAEQHTGQPEALAHAERVAADLALGDLGQPDEGQHLVDRAPARRRCWRPASAGGCGPTGPGGRTRRRAARRSRTAAGAATRTACRRTSSCPARAGRGRACSASSCSCPTRSGRGSR